MIESTNPTTEETTGTTENSAENSSKDISVDEVHFPDQNFRQVLIGNGRKGIIVTYYPMNYWLQLSWILVVEISKSLDGIEYFKRLKNWKFKVIRVRTSRCLGSNRVNLP